MPESNHLVSGKTQARAARFRRVVGMFLDGCADRASDTDLMRKYAHVYRGPLTVCVTDEDTPDHDDLDKVYEGFKWLGVIDLDDGELAGSSGETALGRVNS